MPDETDEGPVLYYRVLEPVQDRTGQVVFGPGDTVRYSLHAWLDPISVIRGTEVVAVHDHSLAPAIYRGQGAGLLEAMEPWTLPWDPL